MQNHADVKRIYEERLKQDCCKYVRISDAYVEFKDEFIEIISDSLWEGRSGLFNIEKHWIELSPADAKPIYCAPYWKSQETAIVWGIGVDWKNIKIVRTKTVF